MPVASVWLIRGALLNFALGITLGAGLLVQKAVVLHHGLWVFRSLHEELLLFGFMVQLAFGVGLWIFPRQGARRSTGIPWPALVLLNAGVWMTGLGALGSWTLEITGRLAETAAIAVFARRVWPRLAALRVAHRTD